MKTLCFEHIKKEKSVAMGLGGVESEATTVDSKTSIKLKSL